MDYTILPETESQIIAYLKKLGCCSSCCLRLVGTRTSDYFRDPIRHLKSLNNSIEDDFDDNKLCVACLGVLQSDIQEKTSKQIIDLVNSNGYDCSTFTCTLSLPVSLSLRERYLQISLTEEFDLSENQRCHLKLQTQNIKDVWKIQILPSLEDGISKQHIWGSSPSHFLIDTTYKHIDDSRDCQKFFENYEKQFKSKNKICNNIHSRNNIDKLLSNIEDEDFMKCFSLLLAESSSPITIGRISCFHKGIFIGGRYNKFSRHLSQTPWYINGEKKMETSVQDLLCSTIVKYTKADSLKFLSSGREDVDVRTINEGRPFAVELVNPKVTNISAEKLAEIVNEVNISTSLVKITSPMRILCSADLKKLKEGENVKTKFYRAFCILRHESKHTVNLEQLADMNNIKIIQKTPIRVLHRRPLTPRIRIIHKMRARWLTMEEIEKIPKLFGELYTNDLINKLFVIDVKTQAGTYVKEFVHGDFGRTRPCLCDILDTEVDIIALDVTSINIDWP